MMPFKPILVAAALLSFTPVAPALAQEADFQVRELSRADQEYIRSARPFAECLVARRAQEIPKFLGNASSGNQWTVRAMAKAHPECRSPKETNEDNSFMLAGALLEALIQQDFGAVPAPRDFDHVPPLVYVTDTQNELIRESFKSQMEPYDCVTRAEPAKVQSFLRTEPLSAEERAAFLALKSALAACHPKQEKWDIRAYFARRYLAETFFTLMKVDARLKAGRQ